MTNYTHQVPAGSLVKPKPSQIGQMGFRVDNKGHTMLGSYDNIATVIGAGRNILYRTLWFHVPWENREGMRVIIAEVHIDELEVIKT